MAESNPYDLILLDLMLPKLDGLSVLQQVRRTALAVPVLVLTARGEKESVVARLNDDGVQFQAGPSGQENRTRTGVSKRH